MDKNLLKKIVFLVLFAALAYVALRVDVFALQGVTGKSFTLFEFFGPIAGAFLGIGGALMVFAAKFANAIITATMNGTPLPLDIISLVKLTPMMFAAYYFWKNGSRAFEDKLSLIVPAVAILAFWFHPIGQQAWFYALYWLIPIAVKFLPDKLFLRSLGSTFTAHSVGSVLFLYTTPTTSLFWIALIPIVAIERLSFASGISVAHVVFTTALNAIDGVWAIKQYINLERQYAFQMS